MEDLHDDFTSFKKFITEDLLTVKRELKVISDRFIAVEKGYCNQNQNNSTWGIHENTDIDFNIRILQEKNLLLQNTNSLLLRELDNKQKIIEKLLTDNHSESKNDNLFQNKKELKTNVFIKEDINYFSNKKKR